MDNLRRALEPLQRKLRMMAGRAVLSLMQDAVSVQIKALDGEDRDGAELFQQYGFRSRPLKGAEGVLLSIGGNRDHTVVICMDDRRYQLDLLQDGEAAMYTDEGDYLVMKRGRLTTLNTHTFVINAQTAVEINTQTMTVNASNTVQTSTSAFSVDAGATVGFSTGAFGVSASAGAQMECGLLQVVGGDIKADDISLKNHKTTGVKAGSDLSGGPT